MTSRAQRALSFGTVAQEYDRLRPSPADEAMRWLLPDPCAVAVDLAAGTGLFTRALLRRVPTVIAVEPDERMRAVLSAQTPGVTVVDGRGEQTGLPEASADGIFVSSAWHWMDPERAVPEIARVVRDGGRFGLIWTSRDRQVDWVQDLEGLLRPPAGDVARDLPRSQRPGHIELPDTGQFADIDEASFSFTRLMAIDALVGMLGTYSGVITLDPEQRAAVLERARAWLAERFGGVPEIEVPMRSHCWRADRVPRSTTGERAAGDRGLR